MRFIGNTLILGAASYLIYALLKPFGWLVASLLTLVITLALSSLLNNFLNHK